MNDKSRAQHPANRHSHGSVDEVLNRIRGLVDRRSRDRQRLFWAEGIRHFVQAYDARYPIETIVHSPILLRSGLAEMLARRLRAAGTNYVRVTPEQFRSISTADRAAGIGIILRQRWWSFEQLDAGRGLCWLIIEHIRSPGNLGTILRTAEACGASGVLFLGSASDPFDPAVVRASMGGITSLPLARASATEVRAWADKHHVQVVGMSPEGERLWSDLPINGPVAIVLGEERQGMSPRLHSLCDMTVRLPIVGRADSLNVSVAAGAMLYELLRRSLPVA